ncbi:MAG: outer membrane protein assembly factor BamA, partial [Phycisphaerae bacterium]
LLLATALSAALAPGAGAQQSPDQTTVIDSIAVEGHRRVSRRGIITTANIPIGQPITWRHLQRAMAALYATRQFDDVRMLQGTVNGKEVLRIALVERPLLTGWTVRGVEAISERKVRGRVRLLDGRPYDPAAAVRSRAAIDSLYERAGYYLTDVSLRELPQLDGSLRVVFDISEGRRVTVSQVAIEGNEDFSDGDVSGAMKTKPEGFWWFRNGEYNEAELERDVRERLPAYYGQHGYIDFQVLSDTLLVGENTGKGTLALTVDEGQQYEVGTFEIIGNRYFSVEQLERLYPFGREKAPRFDQAKWEQATELVQTLYLNNGYIYAQVAPIMTRRTTADGRNLVDLRWQIVERQPAIVNKVLIRGNTVTHEDVIRRAILMVPGDVIRQEALIRSYQNISNLNFFEQPIPPPTTEQANQQGDVNVIFHVRDRHTGNINFGASVGQGTGLGGFIGLNEPNLFGRAKQVAIQWQFGRNINDFNVSYTDPALRGSFISGTVTLHSSRLRFTVGDLGRIRSRGGSVRIGLPLGRSRFTRLFLSYTLEQSEFD